MHKLLVLYPEPHDRVQFAQHYETTHLPLVQELPGMRACRYSLDLSGQDEQSGYFAVFEADFDDNEALVRALSSPQGAAVQADVPNYATGGAIILDYPVTNA